METGFTLLEVLVALTLMTTAFALIWGVFSSMLGAWRRGGEVLDRLHRGDFVFDRLEASLRSAAWYPSQPARYGFRLETAGGETDAEDVFSWVTVSDAFQPRGKTHSEGMRRLTLRMEDGPKGDRVLAVRAQHVLADPEKLGDEDEDLLTAIPEVRGVRCEIYYKEDKEWRGEWTDTNALPERVRVTLSLEPLKEEKKPVVLQRIILLATARAAKATALKGHTGREEAPPDGTLTPGPGGNPGGGRRSPRSGRLRGELTPPGPSPRGGSSQGRSP